MSGYEVRNVTSLIVDFVKTCPFLDEFNVDIDNMSIQKIASGEPDGSAVDYVGSTQLSNVKDINNRGYSARQANFNIWLLRRSGHDFYREEIADFIWNFEQWVEYCQYHDKVPKLSLDPSGRVEERMFADNGVFFGDWEDEDSSLYMIQLHIIYYNNY